MTNSIKELSGTEIIFVMGGVDEGNDNETIMDMDRFFWDEQSDTPFFHLGILFVCTLFNISLVYRVLREAESARSAYISNKWKAVA